MFLFVFVSLVQLGLLVFVLRWAFGQPHGMLDASVRVLVATVAGSMLAIWIVAAALVPQLNEEAKQDGSTFGAPSITDARTMVDEVVASAPTAAASSWRWRRSARTGG
jgi:hypothetical protein